MRAAVVALAALATTARAQEFTHAIEGVELRPEVGTGIYGYEATGNLGVASFGARGRGGHGLLLWDGTAEVAGGAVAYEHPFYALYGARAQGEAEGLWRTAPARSWSPAASLLLGARASALTQPGVPFDGGPGINNLGSLGGVQGGGDARLGFGASLLDDRQSFVAEAQALAEGDSAEPDLPAAVFFGAALRARYDRKGSLTAIGEAAYGVTPAMKDAALGTSTTEGRWTLSALCVKQIGAFFAGAGLSVARTASTVAFAAGRSYPTASPVDSRLWILGGWRLF